ncbi:hypothetical protein HDU76_002720 [Blyttiomyces sp. JEL0837]|nr:hypothetical protein HDU76_002720 [Blyttiomyces sp. JEL0837]
MGGKNSKSRPSSAAAKQQPQASSNDTSTPSAAGGDSWQTTEFAKSHWTPISKLLNLAPDHDVKRKLKAWCKQNSAAKVAKLGDMLDAYDDIAKRREVFQAGQRIGDSLEQGQEILEANGKSIIEKYLSPSAAKDLRSIIGGEWENGLPSDKNLTDSTAFDSLSTRILECFEKAVLTL